MKSEKCNSPKIWQSITYSEVIIFDQIYYMLCITWYKTFISSGTHDEAAQISWRNFGLNRIQQKAWMNFIKPSKNVFRLYVVSIHGFGTFVQIIRFMGIQNTYFQYALTKYYQRNLLLKPFWSCLFKIRLPLWKTDIKYRVKFQ